MSEPKVFFQVPAYDGTVSADTAMTVMRAGKCVAGNAFNGEFEYFSSSALCHNFNALWARALNTREQYGWTHFAMLHADMATEIPYWLDTLVDELERSGADVLSAISPIKNGDGLTSTGFIDDHGNAARFSLAEVHSFPMTFGIEETSHPTTRLLVNTGMWVCRFDSPWVEKIAFRTIDRIHKCTDGVYRVEFIPEDWLFSHQCSELGLKVKATRIVPVKHIGRKAYCSNQIWGHAIDPALNAPTIGVDVPEPVA